MSNKSDKTARCKDCSICSLLSDYESGLQKHAHEDEDTFLPVIAEKLKTARDLKPNGYDRQLLLRQCPECGTYYLFKTDYEYLADGSEDEQTLKRLTDEEAVDYLQRPIQN